MTHLNVCLGAVGHLKNKLSYMRRNISDFETSRVPARAYRVYGIGLPKCPTAPNVTFTIENVTFRVL